MWRPLVDDKRKEFLQATACNIEKLLNESGITTDEVWSDNALDIVCVSIPWGDWKHDHAYADYLVAQHGGERVHCHVTEEDGSDCYSAVHYYKFGREAQ